ncbi:hypothetical protein BDQ12DRAFT_671651 [Crucibulum laeve]|uniref:Uncharacterized protein n=1 Tax=Crucibulum laeve TaxID=68775 RepID=A0A5C3LSH1_9AGAR|nr:hypothetical protein BDQ12DRAFT_671651 [Crucibulum laeve]
MTHIGRGLNTSERMQHGGKHRSRDRRPGVQLVIRCEPIDQTNVPLLSGKTTGKPVSSLPLAISPVLDYENFNDIAIFNEGPQRPTQVPSPSLGATRTHASCKHRAELRVGYHPMRLSSYFPSSVFYPANAPSDQESPLPIP